ncbi:hypothetical protein GIJ05_04615 [Laceyella tengchongensis]|jgi:protocatechuate 3,4-dioxygenase beta subunit|nr:hypothetical protein [Laceyella tengchongensis]
MIMNLTRFSSFFLSLLSIGMLVSAGCNNLSGDAPNPQPGQRITVTGTVVDTDGHPIAQVLVMPEPADDKSGPIPEIAVYTDAEGRFSWTVPPGTYDFVFRKPGYALHKERVQAIPGKQAPHLRVELKPN